jgi:hypothetical protein
MTEDRLLRSVEDAEKRGVLVGFMIAMVLVGGEVGGTIKSIIKPIELATIGYSEYI